MKTSLNPVTSGGTLAVIAACLSMGFPGLTLAADCDVDNDGDVDRLDVKQIVIVRDTRASGPNDPRDANGDGIVNMLDARACIKQCSLLNCTIIGAGSSPPGGDASRTKPPKPAPIQNVPQDVAKPGSATSEQSIAGTRPGTIISGNEWRVKSGDT